VPSPELWIVAGPNGAGKTTLVQGHPILELLPRVRFLNPDDFARDLLMRRGHAGFSDAPDNDRLEAFLQAAKVVDSELQAGLRRGEAIGVETVLSTNKYRLAVEAVQAQGGFVGLIYVALSSPELACRRVARRVRAGGHDVPTEKTHLRWHRSISNLAWFAARASAFWIIDNSDENPDHPPKLVAAGRMGAVQFLDPSASEALRNALDRLPRLPSA
jgi:predicted ABC-type ATPase